LSDAKRLAELQSQRANLDRAIAALELLRDTLAEITPPRAGRAKERATSAKSAKVIPFVPRSVRAVPGNKAVTSR